MAINGSQRKLHFHWKKNPLTNAQLLVSHETERYVFARNDSHSDVLFVVVVEEF